jgi:hypothetical protein
VPLGELHQAIVAWQKGRTDAAGLREAHNTFDSAAFVESTALNDDELRNRVNKHRRLVWILDDIIHRVDNAIPKQAVLDLSETVLYHQDLVLRALEAHVQDKKPPPGYQAPPVDDLVKLLRWGAERAQQSPPPS